MTHRLNTNKQFMVGNGILAFAVIFVVVIFVYMSMRLQREKQGGMRYYAEMYEVCLTKGFEGQSVSVFINDSLLVDTLVKEEPLVLQVKRFADESALMIVDNATEKLALFELSDKGGKYRFVKEEGAVKLLAKE